MITELSMADEDENAWKPSALLYVRLTGAVMLEIAATGQTDHTYEHSSSNETSVRMK